MGIKKVPDFDGNRVAGDVAEAKSDYNGLSKEQVEVWQEKLQISVSNRQKEQGEKVTESGGKDAHEKRLKDDPVYRKEWEGHEERINKEEKAFGLAGEWLDEYDKK